MAPEAASSLTQAVIAGNVDEVERCLRAGESPNGTWGDLPLLTHAALLPNRAIFRSLIKYGAKVPDDLLSEIITWETGDWRITSGDEEQQLADILQDLRNTRAWPQKEKREKLAELLNDYKLRLVTDCLLRDT